MPEELTIPRVILGNNTLPPVTFAERVAAARAAGFREIGYSILSRGAEPEISLEEMRSHLDAHGITVAELEVVLGFDAGHNHPGSTGPGPAWGPPELGLRAIDGATEREMFEVAEALGVGHLVVVGSWGPSLPPEAAERFAGLCDRAAEHGLRLALEFVPGTNVPDVGTALQVVEEAGRSNGGIVVDIWHHRRGENDDDALRAMDPERVVVIHLSDGALDPVDPDYFADTMQNRELPGDGEWDVPGFLRLLRDAGVDAPVSLEVLSTTQHARPAHEAARLAFASTTTVLAEAYGAALAPRAEEMAP